VPEGDTIHRTAITLRRVLAGQTLTTCESELAVVDDWQLPGRRVARVEARGKNLLIHCDPLAAPAPEQPAKRPEELALTIWSHMGMTGAWHVYRPGEAWKKPVTQAKLVLHTPTFVVPCFSPKALELLGPQGLLRHPQLRDLGPDLLDPDCNFDEALDRLQGLAEVELGDAIMRQSAVAGIGNEYKSELLFLCRLDPFTRVAGFTREQLRSLLARARELMQINMTLRGPRRTRFSLDRGSRVWVYERSGEPCFECGTSIRMRRQGALARSTYYCGECQQIDVHVRV
jgi:endonuclease-8